MSKITVYECGGTSVEASITGKMQYVTPEQIAQGVFYQGLDRVAFDYVFVQGYANQIKPLMPSVTSGVNILSNYLNTGSGKFALIGTSQGAMIASLTYRKLKAGELNRSLSDCVGVFLYGNPVREAGKAFPGATSIPAGHGIAPANMRNTGTVSDTRVWEFAIPGDPVCTNGDDFVSGLRTQAFNSLLTSWDGTLDSLGDVGDIAADLVGWFSFGVTTAPGMAFFHMGYDKDDFQPISGDPRNATQIAIDHLNKIAAPAARADGWSTTLRVPTS